MSFITPPVGEYKKFTKDLIMLVLTREYPLSIKKIKNIIKKEYGISATYQAIRKSVRLLQEKGVVVENNKQYSINKNWIEELEDYCHTLKKNYFSDKTYTKKKVGDVTEYTFNNLVELNRMWRDLHVRWLKKEKDERSTAWWGDHCWWILTQLNEEDSLLKQIQSKRNKTYWLNNGATFLDKWAKNYYSNYSYCYYKTNRGKYTGTHLVVFGDTILQVNLSKALQKELNSFYERVNRFSEVEPGKLLSIVQRKRKLKLTVMKNNLVADGLRDKVLGHFDR